jgi:hypothetical protein
MNAKKIHILCISIITLLFMCNLVSASSDGTNDVWHQSWTGTGYQWEAYSGSKSNIDITDISYSIDGSTATVSMTTVGNMADNENVVYTMHLQSSDSAYYMIMYSNGNGAVMGMGNYQGFSSQLTNPISGNKFTTSFEVSDPSANYEVIAFNVEHTNIDEEHGEAWWDYAPNSEAPYYGLGGDGNNNGDSNGDTGGGSSQPSSGTPGFELLVVIAAIGIASIELKRRK